MEQPSRATLKDVAIRSGYALRTVKKVMSGNENVGSKTRISVLHAAKELNYQRNIIASALSRGKSCRIAIVYTETTKLYFPEVEKGFTQCAKELRDFGLSIDLRKVFERDVSCQAEVLKDIINDKSVDGLIVQPMSCGQLNPYIDEIAMQGRPVITFGADAPLSKRLCYIGPDAYKAGRIGAQILANYIGKNGHVALISDYNEHLQTIDRKRGFTDRIKEHYPNLRVTDLNIPLNNTGLFYEIVRTLVSNESIQGIFCTDANSYIAGEVLHDLQQKDTVVVGFDISQMAADLMHQGYLKVIIEQHPFHFSYSALKAMFNYLYLEEKPQTLQHTALSILTSECLDA